MSQIPTVKIKRVGTDRTAIINESDFNSDIHELIAGDSSQSGKGEGDSKTASEVLAMLDDEAVTFFEFAAAAKKTIGGGAPSKKAELIEALQAIVAEQAGQ